ncbi:TPA: hypothetical protein HA246_02625 [Candidatus Woesearchaeota archaeon]|nr:hypothetical protein [Candidatus Woesearchaeota archaeon]
MARRNIYSNTSAQLWSYDIIVAVVLFILAFIGFYALLTSSTQTTKTGQLSNEGSIVATITGSTEKQTNISFVQGDKLNLKKFNRFANQNYTETRRQLGIGKDFCIHFEDADGNVINVSGKTTIGSSKINVTLNEAGATFQCGNA